MDFDWQVTELASLSFPLAELLNRLCRKLEAHRLAAEEIRLSLKLADGSWFERAVPLSSPLTDPRVLPHCCAWIWRRIHPARLLKG